MVSATAAASPRPADRPAPTTVPYATACVQPGCTGTIVDQYCDVCGTPANASISVAAGAGKSRGRHPLTIAPAGASPRRPDRPAPPAVPQTTACMQPGCTGSIVDDYCDICGAPASAGDSVRLEPAAAPAKPEPVPTKTAAGAAPATGVTAVPQLTACTQPGCTGTIVDGYCDVCGTPASAPDSVPPETAAAVPTPPTSGPATTAATATTPAPAPEKTAPTTPPEKTAAAAKPEPAPAVKTAAAQAQPEPPPAAAAQAKPEPPPPAKPAAAAPAKPEPPPPTKPAAAAPAKPEPAPPTKPA